jgi:hypothetical protein
VCFAGYPVLSVPNGARLARAIAGLDFSVAIDLYLNETSRLAHLVLPPTHVFESGNYELVLSALAVRNVARYSPPIVPRDGDTRDDWETLSQLALRMRLPRAMAAAVAGRMRGVPERVLDVLLRFGPHHLRLDEVRRAEHGLDLGPLRPGLAPQRLRTDDGRLRLAPPALVADLARLERWLDEPDGDLVLMDAQPAVAGEGPGAHEPDAAS